MLQKQDRSFVFTFLDIFKHLKGSGIVDKIKKCRRDIPQDRLHTLAVEIDLTLQVQSILKAAVCKQSLGNPSRYSLLYSPDIKD